jgi:hypothetical protein
MVALAHRRDETEEPNDATGRPEVAAGYAGVVLAVSLPGGAIRAADAIPLMIGGEDGQRKRVGTEH